MRDIKNVLSKIKQELPNAMAVGVIDVSSGLPIAGIAEQGIDIETTAAYFAHSLITLSKATKVVDPNTVLKEMMAVTDSIITLFLFTKSNYAVGVTVRAGVQLGLVRAVLKNHMPEIEQELP